MLGPQTMSVEDYTRYFVKKIVKDEKYRDSTELSNAGTAFYSLLQRFAREGDREDVRTPFKIMKDEFMNEWRAASRDARDELIRRLFCVLDIVHEESQNAVQNCTNGTEVCYTILEEFRLRLMKMVVGDTWKDALPLRIEALKHMHKYRNRELDGYYTQESRKNTLKHRARHLAVKKLKRTVAGPTTSSWTAVFNDLLLTSGSKLAPLLFAILDENQVMEDHLLSITDPKLLESFHSRSMASTKSGSSLSSSSIRPGSEADNSLPATDEEGTYYFKSLNSELNAKLQLFKQRGLAQVMTKVRRASKGSVEAFQQPWRSVGMDSTTSRSDCEGNQEYMQKESHRSVTPFLDEPPPPWGTPSARIDLAEMQLSDGDADDDPIRLNMNGDKLLKYRSSAHLHPNRNPQSIQHPELKKASSCNGNQFSFASPHSAHTPFRRSNQILHQPADLDHFDPFHNLDPLNASRSRAFE